MDATQLQQQAAAELELRRRRRAALGVVDFVPAAWPEYQAPEHIAPYASVLESVETTQHHVTVTAPPRHAKTETTLAAIARLMMRKPRIRVAYACYGLLVSWEKSKRCFEIAKRAGVRFSKRKQKTGLWETEAGGVFFATGVGGSLTGLGFDLLVVDDPHKDRADAESVAKRRRVHDWFSSTAMTRVEPGGSAIVSHTRWHPDDLIGHLHAADAKLPPEERLWRSLSFPAIRDDGRALWEARWPLKELAHRRKTVTEYDWWALFMCSPRPRGDTLFRDAYYYPAPLATGRVRYAIGVDLAYTAKSQADYSVAVVLAERDGEFFVVEVVRKQCQAPVFAAELRRLAAKYRGAKLRSYAYGPEKGSIDFIRKEGVNLVGIQAGGDKFVRAQGVAAAWNRGAVQLPEARRDPLELASESAESEEDLLRLAAASPDVHELWQPPKDPYPWVSDFVTEINGFTGVNDANDDQVDALAAAYDALTSGPKGKRTAPLPAVETYDSPMNF